MCIMADFDYKNEMMNRIMLDSSLRRQVERQNAAPPVDDESYVHKVMFRTVYIVKCML